MCVCVCVCGCVCGGEAERERERDREEGRKLESVVGEETEKGIEAKGELSVFQCCPISQMSCAVVLSQLWSLICGP